MDSIFQTTNTALAVTLATCGVPFDEDPLCKRPIAFLNYYSREILLKLGYKDSGLKIEDAALDAWRKGKRGLIVYCFRRLDPFEAVIKSYDRHSGDIKRADETAGGVGSQPLSTLPVMPELAAQICCQFAKNRTIMLEGWRGEIPWIHYPGEVETVTEGGAQYKVGSMKLHRLGASMETKQKIGL